MRNGGQLNEPKINTAARSALEPGKDASACEGVERERRGWIADEGSPLIEGQALGFVRKLGRFGASGRLVLVRRWLSIGRRAGERQRKGEGAERDDAHA